MADGGPRTTKVIKVARAITSVILVRLVPQPSVGGGRRLAAGGRPSDGHVHALAQVAPPDAAAAAAPARAEKGGDDRSDFPGGVEPLSRAGVRRDTGRRDRPGGRGGQGDLLQLLPDQG